MRRKKTDSSKNSNHNSNEDGASETYEIGYGKPPKEYQFKKGRSGNPRGRPKKKQIKTPSHPHEPFKDAFLKAAYRRVKTENGPTVTMAEAVAHSIATKAAQGHFQSQKLFTQFMTNLEQQDRKEREDFFRAAVEYKIETEKELQMIREAGLEEREIVPHPDHIELDPLTLSVTINGPATKEQKEKWDMLIARRDEAIKNILEWKNNLQKTKNPSKIMQIENDIAFEQKILEIVLNHLQPKQVNGGSY
jgi:hypothetical protein